MSLLSRWKEKHIITNVYREEKKKQNKLMKHARNYHKSHRKKSLSKYMGSKRAKKKFDSYQIPGVDEANFTKEKLDKIFEKHKQKLKPPMTMTSNGKESIKFTYTLLDENRYKRALLGDESEKSAKARATINELNKKTSKKEEDKKTKEMKEKFQKWLEKD